MRNIELDGCRGGTHLHFNKKNKKMIGRKITWAVGRGEQRVEGQGTVIDKCRFTDVVRGPEDETIGVSGHDIYVVEKDDGRIESVHPLNIIKTIDNEKSN